MLSRSDDGRYGSERLEPRGPVRPRRGTHDRLLRERARLPGDHVVPGRCVLPGAGDPRTTTTSACSRSAARRGRPRRAAAPSVCTTWRGRWRRSTTSNELADVLSDRQALVGASDHGTTKSLYAKDPDGLEFEVVWLIPAHLLTDDDLTKRSTIGPLDLAAEIERFGRDRGERRRASPSPPAPRADRPPP